MDSNTTFGRWLKQRRRQLDLTQYALAEQSGCTVETIRKIEADRRRPSRSLLERLAEALEIPTADRATFERFARRRSHAAPFPT
jgi:transcriptional regulator with XRE-family HTH domain